MRDQTNTGSTVLFAGENPRAAAHTEWDERGYRVGAVDTGEAALAAADEHDVDVLVLGSLPDVPADEVTVAVRDRGLGARVLRLAGTRPSGDPLARGYDDYLVEPSQAELVRTVDRLVGSATYDSVRYELSVLRVWCRVLEHERADQALLENDRYNRARERIETLERREAAYRHGVETDQSPEPLVPDSGLVPSRGQRRARV
jgi:DNA-binding response OmpR family regulator